MNEGLRVEEAGFGALGHETSRFGIEDSERVCVCVFVSQISDFVCMFRKSYTVHRTSTTVSATQMLSKPCESLKHVCALV